MTNRENPPPMIGTPPVRDTNRPPLARRRKRYTYWADSFRFTCEDAVTSEVLSEDLVCGKGYACPDGYVCSDAGYVALNHGLTGYHDVWHAMLQVKGKGGALPDTGIVVAAHFYYVFLSTISTTVASTAL